MRTVVLHGEKAAGRVALVDDGDYELVMQYRWHLREVVKGEGRRPSGPYAWANVPRHSDLPGSAIAMHKLITGWLLTDHKDHDGLNNQRHNLREATNTQNLQNMQKRRNTTSRFKGVGVYRRKCGDIWKAYIRLDGEYFHLGVFEDDVEAALAYDAAAREHFGEFACVNFETEADIPVGQLSLSFGPAA